MSAGEGSGIAWGGRAIRQFSCFKMLFSGADSRLVLSFRLRAVACLSSATAASSSSLFLYVMGIGGGQSFVYLNKGTEVIYLYCLPVGSLLSSNVRGILIINMEK